MKYFLFLLTLLTFHVSRFTSMAWCGFQSTPVSIKAEAMGGAFVGMADDSSSLFLNPAGLSTLNRPELSMMYGSPIYGLEGLNLSQGYAAMGLPINRMFSMGLGGTLFKASGILSEYQAVAGVSARLGSRIAVGANATYLYHSYDIGKDPFYAQESVFANGISKGAVGVDLGVLAFITKNIQIGLSARHMNSPDIGLRDEDPVPREIRMGTLFRTRFANLLFDLEQRNNGLGIGSNSQDTTWRAGVEVPMRALALRLGANSNAFTAGLGVQIGPFGLDYAFAMFNDLKVSNYGTQLLSMSFKFGESRGPARASRKKSKDGWDGDGSNSILDFILIR